MILITNTMTKPITITIVELIAMTRLSRDTFYNYIKDHSQPHLVSVDLQLSTRKVVSLSQFDC